MMASTGEFFFSLTTPESVIEGFGNGKILKYSVHYINGETQPRYSLEFRDDVSLAERRAIVSDVGRLGSIVSYNKPQAAV